MATPPPFVDPATGELDTNQLLSEAISLGKLVAAVVVVGLVPFAISALLELLLFGDSFISTVLVLIAQFVLAVGTGIVLMYVIARGLQLSGE